MISTPAKKALTVHCLDCDHQAAETFEELKPVGQDDERLFDFVHSHSGCCRRTPMDRLISTWDGPPLCSTATPSTDYLAGRVSGAQTV